MSTQIIAENLIESEQFSSASEEAGPYWGIPDASSENTGDLKPIISGDAEDFTYSGTATSAGAADGTTVIDSVLGIYGDDFFIGATVTLSSETRTVSDFERSTGTLTVSTAFTSQVASGTSFSLNLSSLTRDFRLELIAGGDLGTATWKWSHDGGAIYLGRDNPEQATWAERTVAATHNETFGKMLELQNGDLLMFYGVTNVFYCKTSADRGITWGDANTVASVATSFASACQLSTSGRVLALLATNDIYYSDDDGETWAVLSTTGLTPAVTYYDIMELNDGSLLAFHDDGASSYCERSTDYGVTWAGAVTVGGGYRWPRACVLRNGDVFCIFRAGAGIIVYGTKSTDNGATWSAPVTVADLAGKAFTYSDIVLDINDHLLCFCYNNTDSYLMLSYSSDDGATWSATELAVTAHAANYPSADIFQNEVLVTAYISGTGLVEYRRGNWTTYSANAAPTRPDTVSALLVCGAEIKWIGLDGVAGDSWQFEEEHEYAMENMIEDPPSIPWHSEQTDIECNIVLDAGEGKKFYCTGVGFFGCNLRNLNFQMNDDNDDWSSPSVDEEVSFDIATGTVDSCSGDMVVDSSLFSTYDDHELAGYYIRFTQGSTEESTWKIIDNLGNYVIVDKSPAWNSFTNFPLCYFIGPSTPFAIYGTSAAATFTGGTYRYIRLNITAQGCHEGYYRIGTMRAARVQTLSEQWQVGYTENFDLGYNLIQTADGGIIPIDSIGGSPRTFDLTFPASNDGRLQVSHLLRLLRGRAICLIPDSTVLTDCYLVTAEPSIEQRQDFLDYFTMSIRLREIL